MSYQAPEPLERRHDLSGFGCGSAEQTEWLQRFARQSMASGATRVFVVTPTDSDEVVAYYAWTMAQINVADAPTRLAKGGGRYPQPVARLARLGVHTAHEGKGLGAGLLQTSSVGWSPSATRSAAEDCSCTPSPNTHAPSTVISFRSSNGAPRMTFTSCSCSRTSSGPYRGRWTWTSLDVQGK